MSALKFCKDCKWSITPPRVFQSQYPAAIELRCSHDRVNQNNERYLASGQTDDMKYAGVARMRLSGWLFDTCGHRAKLWERKA